MDDTGPPSATTRHGAVAPVRTTLSLLLPLGVVLVFVLLVAAAATTVVRWWLFEETGSQWLLQRLPGLQVQGFRGALLGDRWQADRVQLSLAQDQISITVEGLSLSGMRWGWRPNDAAWVGLEIERFGARKVTIKTGEAGPRPIPLPPSLALPLQLAAGQGQIDELRVDSLPPFARVAVQGLLLDARAGAEHRVDHLQADWYGVRTEASLSVGNAAPLPMKLQASLRPEAEGDTPRWGAVLRMAGPLSAIELSGTLRGVPRAGLVAPSVDVQAGLQILQAWPLASLRLRSTDLDLSALTARAPQTRLTVSATLAPRVADTPLSAAIEIDNALPGRWNERRLPLQRLRAELRGRPDQPNRLEVRGFELALADNTQSAGRITGNLVWQGHELQLDAKLAAVTPQRLDGRAAAMQLSGPVLATLLGLPAPDGAGTTPAASARWKVDLEGRLDAAPQPVRLSMEGSATDKRLELSSLRASSGKATAELNLLLQQVGSSEWRLGSIGNLVDFDPVPWWPGAAGSALRKLVHRVSADWQLDLRLPDNAAALPTLELAQRLAGNGTVRVHDSVLAGVALSANLKLGYTQAAAPTTALLNAEVLLGGNRLGIEGRGNPAGSGQADRWRLELKADSLSALAPLSQLHPALADWMPRQGTASAVLAAEGRWPNLRSEGSAQVVQLKAGTFVVARGQIDWRLESGLERPLSMKLDLAGLQLGQQRADHLRATVSGTLAEHRIDIAGALPLRPPEAAARLLGVQAQSGTRLQMQAQGNWRADAAGGGVWRARVQQLLVGSWDGSLDDAPPASVWARLRELSAELQFDGSGQIVALRADPGRVLFAGDLALRWDAIKIDLSKEQPDIELRADVEAFALAPLLARLQPNMGWSGDLRVGARIEIRAAQRFDADLVIERRDGDLHIASGEGVHLLGLTDVRLRASAHDGHWELSPVFKGRSLGEITGTVRVTSTPERRWPHADAALQGEVQARVADIGIWGAWVPPGWRLGGEMLTIATLSGRFGEPRYVGAITANGVSVRNLLQGVNVSDGKVAVRLEGDKASIGLFTLRGGDGLLTISGDATLGAAPKAHLQIKADRFRALGRIDRLAIVSGLADLTLSGEQARLEGRIVLDEGRFDASSSDSPSLDGDVTVHRPGSADQVDPTQAKAGTRRNFVLGLELDLGSKMHVRGRGVDTGLRGSVRLSNPSGRLEVRGNINATDGSYAAYGQKLTLDRGLIAFGGPPDDPRLDILALRPNIDQRVGVAISGTLQSPRVRLFSEPDMSDTEKLSWLLLGRASEGLGRNDTALLQRAAMALLAGEGEAPTDALLKNLGIDEISLKQGEGDARETVFSLGKQLSRRWYLGYERGVNSATGTWQLIYRIAQRFTVRAQSGLENSLDVIWSWRVQETPADAAMRKSITTPP